MHKITLKYKFVEYIPDKLEDVTVYISIPFTTVAHKCCCGCGNEVITPLSPTDWELIFDGESISLYPSIGNWNFACKSHYWIEHNMVKWVPKWSQDRINVKRVHDTFIREKYLGSAKSRSDQNEIPNIQIAENKTKKSLWKKLREWLS